MKLTKMSRCLTQQFSSLDVFKESPVKRMETLSCTPTQTGGITTDIYRTERDAPSMRIHTAL